MPPILGRVTRCAPLVDRSSKTASSSTELERFYRANCSDMMRLCTALVGPELAEDVFASSVLRVLSSDRFIDLTDDARRGYFYRTMVNEANRIVKRSAKGRVLESLAAASRPIAEPASRARTRGLIDDVAALSVRQRAVIYLTYWEDLSVAQVADRLGISEGSVAQHLTRARQHLRRRMNHDQPTR